MTRVLPSGVSAVATSAGYVAGFAVEVLAATPVRVTDCPSGVTISGNAFAYGFLQVADTTINEHPAISIVLGNTDNVLSSLDLADLARGALDNVAVNLYEVHWDASGNQLGPVALVGSALVTAYTADEAAVQLSVQGSLEVAAGMCGRMCSRSCMYVFKGTRCGYSSGATSCAHTLAACTGLGNQTRFGGYQTMPTLNTQLSYWVVNYVPASYAFGSTVPAATPAQQMPTGNVVRRVIRRTPEQTATTQPVDPVIVPIPPSIGPIGGHDPSGTAGGL